MKQQRGSLRFSSGEIRRRGSCAVLACLLLKRLSDQCDVALAIAMEKLYHPGMERVLSVYEQGADIVERGSWSTPGAKCKNWADGEWGRSYIY